MFKLRGSSLTQPRLECLVPLALSLVTRGLPYLLLLLLLLLLQAYWSQLLQPKACKGL
jgi:hypothetical protein